MDLYSAEKQKGHGWKVQVLICGTTLPFAWRDKKDHTKHH